MVNKKIYFSILAALIIMGSFFGANVADASMSIISAKLNGLSDLVVKGNTLITATVKVGLTGRSEWRSAAYRFGEGEWICVNTNDYAGNVAAVETFLITAPIKAETSKVYFKVYENDECADSSIDNIIMLPASLLTSAANVLAFKTDDILSLSLVILLTAFILAFIVLYAFRKEDKTEIINF